MRQKIECVWSNKDLRPFHDFKFPQRQSASITTYFQLTKDQEKDHYIMIRNANITKYEKSAINVLFIIKA
jgi:hypothetical protein